jgi:hypothetical protein
VFQTKEVTAAVKASMVLISLALLAAPGVCLADRAADHDPSPAAALQSIGVHYFFQNVRAMTPWEDGPVGTADGAVLGVGATFQRRLSAASPFYLEAGGGYGLGRTETRNVQGAASTIDRIDFTTVYGDAGFGRLVPISSRISALGSGRLFYSGTRGSFRTAGSTRDGRTYGVFGLEESIGWRIRVIGRLVMDGEYSARIGWGSGKDGRAKAAGTVKSDSYRGGFLFGF